MRISPRCRVLETVLPEELYVTLYPRLVAFAEGKFRIPERDSHDLVHDVLIRFAQRSAPVQDVARYLFVSVANACIDYLREQSRWVEDAEVAEPARTPRPDRVATLRELLRRLPHVEQRVLLLRLKGWKVGEIAAYFGRSVSWAEKKLHNVREAAADVTNRRREGRGPRRTDTYVSVAVAIMRAHVRRVRGPALPRAAARAAVLRPDRRSARQVRRQLSGARGMVSASLRAA
ncbi:MAG TPA: sigma-70 family RNA polymerase sigma factor [Thermoanaerobaculia bacterium]|nr:sigma-70 family RNA polymerase sigma factor [Thermoanaerobaculia bacterium]